VTSRAFVVSLLSLLVGAGCGGTHPEARPRSATGSGPLPAIGAFDGAPERPQAAAPADVYAETAAGHLSPAVDGVPTRAYVPNSLANTLDVIDASTFAVVGHYDVGKGPQHVTPSYDLRQLYVDNTLGDSLTPIDPVGGRPGTPIAVPDPYNLYFTPDGSRAIVVAERGERLDFRDPHTWQLVKSVRIAHSGPDHLDFSADGRYLVISCEFSGWLVRVDTERMEVTGELHVGGSPVDVRLSPDGRAFYVANQDRPHHKDGVSVVDGENMKELTFIETGKGTHGLYFSRDARTLYATNRLDGSIGVIDTVTNQVRAIWRIPNGSPDMGGVSADGSQFWVTGRNNAEVYVIDTTSGALLHRIPVGKGAHGLCLFPQPGRYSLGHTGNYR
jgi:DNA-binding beta-propeller fold protein YncE